LSTATFYSTFFQAIRLSGDPIWSAWSAEATQRAAGRYRLAINPIIFAEVSVRYDRIEDANEALPISMLDREPISDEAAFLAGKAFATYRRRGGARRSPLPDFFIGAHAAVAGYRLLTRDAALSQLFPSARADHFTLTLAHGGKSGSPEISPHRVADSPFSSAGRTTTYAFLSNPETRVLFRTPASRLRMIYAPRRGPPPSDQREGAP
jgi:predicted nucleic acid-binding protein